MRTLTQTKILSATQQRGYTIIQEIGSGISILCTQWEYTKHKEKHRAELQMGYFISFYFPHLWPSELQSLVKHNKWDFQNRDSYHQVSITSSNTQPSVSISFNKELHMSRHPLKPKTIKTLHSWWMLSKFRESKAYLQTQYEHAMNTAINSKAANALLSPHVDTQKRAKIQEQGKKYIPYQTWLLDTTRFRATLGWR